MFGHHCRRMLMFALVSIAVLGGSAPAARAAARASSVHATVALAPRDPAALAAYAVAVTSPGSPLYRHYLTVAQFARRFGASAGAIAKVRAVLAARGVTVGAVTANRLALEVSSPPRPSGVYAPAASVIPDLSRFVQAVIGPGAAAPSASVTMHTGPIFGPVPTAGARTAPIARAADTGELQPCVAARAVAASAGAYTSDEIASAYGLSHYYAAGDEGRGVTIAVYELEPFSASDVAVYQACFGTGAAVTTVPVDGGAGSGPGIGEAATDVEDLTGLAPEASIRVYEGPRTGTGAYDTYSRIVSEDAAQVISTSWGMCEALKGSVPASAENALFEEAAVQGQSLLAASGDAGSDDCGDGRQSVDDPASQPWVTAVGATSLRGSANVVWNDSLGATGGGVSSLWRRPAYQAVAARSQSFVTCGSSGVACREVPDIAVDGDPETGYVAYYLGSWRTVGGTSVASPTVAALAALADASPACGGHPIGFLNTGLYRAAARAYAANFNDVTSGSNSFDLVAGFAAAPGYDMASGLGTPTALLGQTLCDDSSATPTNKNAQRGLRASNVVRLGRFGNRSGRVGTKVRVRVQAHDANHLPLTFSAAKLPAGLTINHRTGLISGTPRRAGSRTVLVRATDTHGSSATVVFRWTIAQRA
ncbi:MAG: putative Ig domain-containing protein [Solirubrobacterales bacterium]|nr:putative Ig domain-containing protein [Solirubrobacterales bacterium]